MGERVIEPSEIIVGKDPSNRAPITRVNPYVRLIARFFDYSIFFSLLCIIAPPFTMPSFERLVPIEFFAWIPIETLLLATWGTTPGKWLLNTDVKWGHAKRMPFAPALRRSLSVWFRGLGMGIPFINILCMIIAYYRLRAFQVTSWDRDEGTFVVHHPLPPWRLYLVSALAAAGMIFYSYWKQPWL
jgi:hypothetical protein